jgi:hypothetical protein
MKKKDEQKQVTIAPGFDISQLSDADKKLLRRQFEAESAARAKEVRESRALYKKMVNDEVLALYPELVAVSERLAVVKKKIFDTFKTFIDMKADLYDREDDQNRHSFSTMDAGITIDIGFNLNDSWDDTVNVGIGKVEDYMKTLVKDKMSKDLVGMVMKLLSKDSNGNLKASRVLQLRQLADESGNKNFIDAIQIIQDAHRPERTKEFVRCLYKSDKGEKMILPLSITDASLPSNKENAK